MCFAFYKGRLCLLLIRGSQLQRFPASLQPPPLPCLTTPVCSRIHTVKDEAMNCLGFFLLPSLGICSLGVEEEKKPYNEDIHIQVSLLFFCLCYVTPRSRTLRHSSIMVTVRLERRVFLASGCGGVMRPLSLSFLSRLLRRRIAARNGGERRRREIFTGHEIANFEGKRNASKLHA